MATSAAAAQLAAAQSAQAVAQGAYDAKLGASNAALANLNATNSLLTTSTEAITAAQAILANLVATNASPADIAAQEALIAQLEAAKNLVTSLQTSAQAVYNQAAAETATALTSLQGAQDVTATAINAVAAAALAETAAESQVGAAQDAVDAAQAVLVQANADAAAAQQQAIILDATAGASEAAAADALSALQAAQDAAAVSAEDLAAAQALADSTAATFESLPAQMGLDFDVNDTTLFVPNVMPDLGDTAPFNSFLTLFGQFFDHGLDLVTKGGSGTVYIPLQPDDPLYVEGSPTNFMVLTRATNSPGADGILGTADDVREHVNETTPFIDLNQVYTSHESHQVFLREYVRVEVDGVMKTVATGHMLEGQNGGPPTWADIKNQARQMLGIDLTDMDVLRVPLVAADLYGNFIPGANGYAQLVTPAGLLSGTADAPAQASSAYGAGRAFLNDIAHNAAPGTVDHDRDPTTAEVVKAADADTDTGNDIPLNLLGAATTYDNELLDKHYVVGDGRGNENIGLTAVHHVFHSEHNNRVDQIKAELLSSGDVAFINQWLLAPIQGGAVPADTSSLLWNGERLFQASRFSTEMVYQHLVFEEFARLVSPDIDPFLFSNTVDINPAIMAEFAHVVYRFGHSMLTESVDRLAADGQTTNHIGLIDAFLNPVAFEGSGATPDEAAGAILRGMTRQVGNEIDEFLTGALRNNLVGLPLDLGAINIARGRDTGVPSLNEARRQFYEQTQDTTLKPYASWYEFALAIKNPASIINFVAAYGTHSSVVNAVTLEDKRDAATLLVMGGDGAPTDRLAFLNATDAWAGGTLGGLNNVDFWIGGLAEKKVAFQGLLGTTFNFVFEVQMEKLQEGDRFYYLSRTQGMNLLNQLEADSFAELVMRNTDLGNPGAPQRHQQCIEHQSSVDATAHGPPHHLAREQIDHDGQVQPALMGTDVGDVGDPTLVRLGRRELAQQVVWRNHGRLANAHAGSASIVGLRAQPFELEQSCHTMLAAALTQIAHVQRQLAIAVHTATLEPSLLEQARQPQIVLGSWAVWLSPPGVVAAGVHLYHLAHAPHAVLMLVALDECVLHPDCLAKYAAAFFRMSRSSVTRRSSALRRRSSSACEACAWRSGLGTP